MSYIMRLYESFSTSDASLIRCVGRTTNRTIMPTQGTQEQQSASPSQNGIAGAPPTSSTLAHGHATQTKAKERRTPTYPKRGVGPLLVFGRAGVLVGVPSQAQLSIRLFQHGAIAVLGHAQHLVVRQVSQDACILQPATPLPIRCIALHQRLEVPHRALKVEQRLCDGIHDTRQHQQHERQSGVRVAAVNRILIRLHYRC